MLAISPNAIGNPPELIFGIVAAIGTPLDFVIQGLQEDLNRRNYKSEISPTDRPLAGESIHSGSRPSVALHAPQPMH